MALDPHVLEPVDGVAGLEDIAHATGRGHPVPLADVVAVPAQMIDRDIPPVVQRLAVLQDQLGPGRAEIAQAEPAVDVLAEVHDLTVGVDPGDRDRAKLLDPAHGRRGRGRQSSEVVVGDGHRVPVLHLDPAVLDLAGHEIGAADGTGGGRPPGPGGDGEVADLELSEESARVVP